MKEKILKLIKNNKYKLKSHLIILMLFLTFQPSYGIYIPNHEISDGNSYFVGKWNIKTIVTESTCPYVIVGTTTSSKLEIIKETTALTSIWNGGNWSPSVSEIQALSNKELLINRKTKITTNNERWEAVLVDHIFPSGDDYLKSESIVKQYKNGSFVGEYKTFSILTRNE